MMAFDDDSLNQVAVLSQSSIIYLLIKIDKYQFSIMKTAHNNV